MAETYIGQLNEKYLTNVSGATQNADGSINGVKFNENTTGNKFYKGRVLSWDDYEVESKIDNSNAQIESERQAQERKKYADAEAQYNLYQQRLKTERQTLLNKGGALTPEEQEKLRTYNDSMKLGFKDLSKDKQLAYNGLGLTADPATPNPIAPPVRGTEQPGATPTPGQQANGGGGFVPPPEKNKPNQYTFADGHKEYDSTAIPSVLNNGKITPARYFAMNGMNFIRDAKKLATEMGMTNYRGTPGENYALVNFMEEKKNGNPTAGGENRGSNRKFDGIQSDVLPNRFTQEDRDRVMAMTPEEQAKYVSERNVADLKKMLPGNVGLINKVFGTNYTSDDLTGGIGRATIMGTGMTAKGMEVQKLIEGLNEATANKFMSKGAELDNSVKDNERMNTGSVQSGRRKILEDMVDGRTPMGQGTTLDGQDQEYMQAYKDYKRVKANADKYNQMVGAWNNMDPNNVARNKQLVAIQQFVNNMKDTDPQSFQALQGDLDKIPEFISKGGTGKIPTATVSHPADGTKTETTPGTTGKVDIAPASNNNIPDATNGAYTKTNAQNNGGLPTPEVDKGGTILKDNVNPTPTTKSSGGGYVKDEPDARYGYSSNQISRG